MVEDDSLLHDDEDQNENKENSTLEILTEEATNSQKKTVKKQAKKKAKTQGIFPFYLPSFTTLLNVFFFLLKYNLLTYVR